MLLIPIGQENNVVRRTPWVSALLIGLNVLIYLALAFAGDGRGPLRQRLDVFFEYLSAHPYLELQEEMSRRLGDEFQAEVERVRGAWQERGLELDPLEVEAEQARLDELSAEALGAFRARPLERLGYVPAAPRPLALLTSLFVHAGFLHLAGNMLFLFLSGPFVEDRFGRALFAAVYFLSGLAATLAHAAHAPHSYTPLVGASGAIAGVMGAFLVRLARTRIQFLVLPIPILWMLRFKVWLPAFVVLPLWFAEQYWYAHTQAESGVAFWAHVGGFACGLVMALAIKLARVEERVIHPAIEKSLVLEQDPGLERALEARLAGDFQGARRELRALLARRPDDVDAWTESYELALGADDRAELGRALPRLLGLYQRQHETTLLTGLAYDRRWRSLPDLPPGVHLSAAAALEKLGDGRSALAHYTSVIEQGSQDPSVLRALVRRGALLQQGGDLKGARAAYLQARAHPACADAWPALIDRALAEIARTGG